MAEPAPTIDIDPDSFYRDPYPILQRMRRETPICFVPQLGATLITRHDDIVRCEQNIEIFSSKQPGGLMTELMGENMMRKDGAQHIKERKQALPALSPRTTKQIWKRKFEEAAERVLDSLMERETCDLVQEYAMPVSAHALRHITGLMNLTPEQIDSCSQGMIDGIANYAGVEEVEKRCNESTALIDHSIDEMLTHKDQLHGSSLLQVLPKARQKMDSVRANIKLAISGGQNEPRDAIAGCVWALLTHPDQLQRVVSGKISWRQVFEEYSRWVSPIGMSPRRITRSYEYKDVNFEAESRAFLMFGSGNRDESVFPDADKFDIGRDISKAISFGAGTHFCAGAAASRMLIAEVALPKLFQRFPALALDENITFSGWAFRGPVSMRVALRS